MKPTAAEARGLARLKRENPGYNVTLDAYGIAVLTPQTPEQLVERPLESQLATRVEVLQILDAA